MAYRNRSWLAKARARQLRNNQTSSEARLWQELRRDQLGHRFRRQVPIGPYIVDFLCPKQRLVIEVDGETHDDQAADRRRDAYLKAKGFTVLRFWSTEVYEELEAVTEAIWNALHDMN